MHAKYPQITQRTVWLMKFVISSSFFWPRFPPKGCQPEPIPPRCPGNPIHHPPYVSIHVLCTPEHGNVDPVGHRAAVGSARSVKLYMLCFILFYFLEGGGLCVCVCVCNKSPLVMAKTKKHAKLMAWKKALSSYSVRIYRKAECSVTFEAQVELHDKVLFLWSATKSL